METIETKTKIFKCDRCKQDVSTVWRINILSLGISVDLCDKCKDELGDKIVEFIKDQT